MSYPDQQQAYPGYPQQPQAPYPPAQPQYPAQNPQYQGYPAQPAYPQQPQYAPPQAPPPPPMPVTKMSDYLEQPTMSGLSLQFNALGDQHTGTVARDLDDGDFPAQTEMDGKTPKKFRDGRVMTRMVVPLRVRPDARHTDGKASLSVQGQMAAALKQAMANAGAGHLHGIPENGAEITVAWVNSIPPRNPGFNPTKVYNVTYKRPAGAGNGQAAPVTQEQPPWTPDPQQQAFQGQAPQAQPQWPAPGAPLSTPPQPAPPGENPYNNPQLPGYQAPQQPPPPQVPAPPTGMAGPAQQVAAATQAGMAAAQAAQPELSPYTKVLMKAAQGNQLTPEEQAIYAGPPQ